MSKRITFTVNEDNFQKAKDYLGKFGRISKLGEVAFWHFLQIPEEERIFANHDFHSETNKKTKPFLRIIHGGIRNEIPA